MIMKINKITDYNMVNSLIEFDIIQIIDSLINDLPNINTNIDIEKLQLFKLKLNKKINKEDASDLIEGLGLHIDIPELQNFVDISDDKLTMKMLSYRLNLLSNICTYHRNGISVKLYTIHIESSINVTPQILIIQKLSSQNQYFLPLHTLPQKTLLLPQSQETLLHTKRPFLLSRYYFLPL